MKKSKIKIWLISEAAFWKSEVYTVNYFENLLRKEPLTVEWRFIPWKSVWQELLNAFKSKNPPDIFEIGSSWIGTLAEMGFLMPLSIDIFRKDFVVKWVEDISIYGKERIAIPWYIDLSILTVREDILEKFEIRLEDLKDWDGFLSSCKKISQGRSSKGEDVSILPLGFSFRPEPSLLHNLIPFFWGNGWDFPDFGNRPFRIFTDERAIETFDFLARLWKASSMPKIVAYTNSFIIQEGFFRDGSFFCFVTHWSPDIMKMFQEKADLESIKFPILAIPYPAGRCQSSYQWGGGSFLAVSSNTKEKNACFDFLLHFTSNEYLIEKIKNESRFPPYEGVYEKLELIPLEKIRRLIVSSRTYPQHPMWFSIEKLMVDGMSEILWYLTDYEGFEKGAEKIAEKWDNVINEILSMNWGL